MVFREGVEEYNIGVVVLLKEVKVEIFKGRD